MAITNGAIANAKRNRDIYRLLDTKKLSYSLIGKKIGVTRQVVSGVAFRRRHQHKIRAHSPNGGWNKIGHGWQPASYYPQKTLHVAL